MLQRVTWKERGVTGLDPLFRALQVEEGAMNKAKGAKHLGSLEKLGMALVNSKEAGPQS